MRQIVHHSLIVFIMLFISACSGGNKLSETGTGTEKGGGGTTTPVALIVLSMVDASGNPVNNVDGNTPQLLSALYTVDNVAGVGKKVTFSLADDKGQLLVTTALTDENGIAKVEIYAGSVEGAGTATATIGDLASSVDFSVTNPAPVTTEPTSTLELSLVNDAGEVITNVDGSNPQWLSAIYKTNNVATAGKKITFSLTSDIGQLLVTSALTNSQGIAKVQLHAGNRVGAGTASAAVDAITSSFDFSTTNPVAVIEPVHLTVELVNTNGDSITNVSSIEPQRLQATLTHSGAPTAGVKIQFSLTDDIGELKTTSALTDSNGVASVLLYAGAQDGVGSITATVDGVTASFDFSAAVAAVNVVMGDITLLPTSIGPNGTASLTVPINEVIDGVSNPLLQSVNVQFSSACVQAGKAEIASEVATANGVATVTYKDKGCGAVDKINVVTTIGQTVISKNVDLSVGAASLQSIQFTQVSSNFIALKGTGGSGRSETATVTFTVFDELGDTVSDTLVNFKLNTTVGNIEIRPQTQAKTDANGQVDVIVSSGSVAVPVRVIATLDEFPTISTVSGSLSISTGVADYNSFSLSATSLNPDTYRTDGIEVGITARLADHFNNPVPDGTTVQFSTEFGAIASNCLTVDGACTVQWRSQSPRVPDPEFRDTSATFIKTLGNTNAPCLASNGTANGLSLAGLPCFYDNKRVGNQNGGLGNSYGNRISIFAHVLGEESFADSNGSGTYTQGEAFTDLTEAFRDENEDNVFGGLLKDGTPVAGAADENTANNKCYDKPAIACFERGGDNEEYVDLNSNGSFDKGNEKYNGVLCPQIDHDAGTCSRDLVSISRNITILQANGDASEFNIGAIEAGRDPREPTHFWQPVNISAGDSTVFVYATDKFNGLLPVGTTISFVAGNGSIVGPSSCVVGNSSDFGIAGCSVSLTKDDESSSGSLAITVTAPNRTGITNSIVVVD